MREEKKSHGFMCVQVCGGLVTDKQTLIAQATYIHSKFNPKSALFKKINMESGFFSLYVL